MKKVGLFLMLFAAVGVQAQKKASPAKTKIFNPELNKEYTTTSGLKYKIVQKGNGPRAENGAMVFVHYVGTLTNGTKFDSSRDRGQPFSFKLGTGGVIKGWDEGIALLKVGDKAILTVPPQLGYGEMNMGTIPPNSTLIFEVELMDIKLPTQPWKLSNTDTVSTPSGLKYIVVSRNTDATAVQAESGKTVSVHYTGFLLNGKVFDSSYDRGQPIAFPLGQGNVIKGWEEGIKLMKTGDKIRLIIPAELGYGAAGRPPVIPQNATLLFDCELISIQ
ncbi:MAG: FKBP-type peptidyl-prolyl cis-trans isomerase [Bacteroidota bacterium]|jgi:peptidylprolyl isomerase|nr:FKBP-type peptidyl-prolyl cis-trans isomerase [Sphingobacteriales bacterium]